MSSTTAKRPLSPSAANASPSSVATKAATSPTKSTPDSKRIKLSPRAKTDKAVDVAAAADAEFDDDALDDGLLLAAAEEFDTREETSSATDDSGCKLSGTPAVSAAGKSSAAASQPSPSAGKGSSSKPTTTATVKPQPAPSAGVRAPGTANQGTPSSLMLDESDHLAMERKYMGKAWFTRLESEMRKEYFVQLKNFLRAERAAKKTIYPPEHLIHSWSTVPELEKIKVVIVGQDPYHGPGQACGHSFSVPKGVPPPASLKNIYKELSDEFPGKFSAPKHGNLQGWAEQGVLMLNACLTVQASQAGSHHGKGWEPFTRAILKHVAAEAGKGSALGGGTSAATSKIASMFAKKTGASIVQNGSSSAGAGASGSGTAASAKATSSCKGVVFLVWGQPAAKSIAEAGITEKSPNVLILRSPHPSPLSAHRGFLGNGHFKKANEWLEKRYGAGGGIDWGHLP